MEWKDFLNPRSMLTPGIAGSVVMVIANTLWVEFLLPQKWTALILSFLLIIPILVTFSASILENIIYFIFNGLIVFSLAANSNFAGRKLQELRANSTETTAALAVPFKTLQNLATSPSKNAMQVKKINSMQLAFNEKQTVLTLSKNESNNDKQTHSTKEKDKEKAQRNSEKPAEKNREKREFFGHWF